MFSPCLCLVGWLVGRPRWRVKRIFGSGWAHCGFDLGYTSVLRFTFLLLLVFSVPRFLCFSNLRFGAGGIFGLGVKGTERNE